MKRKLIPGLKPDKKDDRDFHFLPQVLHLPLAFDLRQNMPAIYEQENLGSCTGNGIARLMHYLAGIGTPTPSRLQIYYNARKLEGTIYEDAGAEIRDAVKAAHKFGACPETIWPYDISKFDIAPTSLCVQEG